MLYKYSNRYILKLRYKIVCLYLCCVQTGKLIFMKFNKHKAQTSVIIIGYNRYRPKASNTWNSQFWKFLKVFWYFVKGWRNLQESIPFLLYINTVLKIARIMSNKYLNTYILKKRYKSICLCFSYDRMGKPIFIKFNTHKELISLNIISYERVRLEAYISLKKHFCKFKKKYIFFMGWQNLEEIILISL